MATLGTTAAPQDLYETVVAGSSVDWPGASAVGACPTSVTVLLTGAPGSVTYNYVQTTIPDTCGDSVTEVIQTKTTTPTGNYTITANLTFNEFGVISNTSYSGTLVVLPPSKPSLTLARTDLTSVRATGTPDGGTFNYTTKKLRGDVIATLTTSDLTSNPNIATFPDPPNPNSDGSPEPGGLGSYLAKYVVGGKTVQASTNDPYSIPVFGMSCYYTALESDWGSAAHNTCLPITIHRRAYTGTISNPYGYPGKYCRSFIAEVVLNGSGQTNAGADIQYNAGAIRQVATLTGADGSPIVAGQTVARDRRIIPARNSVHVDVDNVGTDLLANDTGGGIIGYRLDFYQGFGKAVCLGYSNPMAVGACTPRQPLCPDGQTP